jgi:hypothetical protein
MTDKTLTECTVANSALCEKFLNYAMSGFESKQAPATHGKDARPLSHAGVNARMQIAEKSFAKRIGTKLVGICRQSLWGGVGVFGGCCIPLAWGGWGA